MQKSLSFPRYADKATKKVYLPVPCLSTSVWFIPSTSTYVKASLCDEDGVVVHTESSDKREKVLVLLSVRPGVRPEPLRWESQVQDIGLPENSWPHIISVGESSPRDLRLNTKTQLKSTTSKLQCWTPHAKQLARQEHNPTQ